jgi:hypothetical protein
MFKQPVKLLFKQSAGRRRFEYGGVDKLVLSSLTQELTTAETTAGEAEEAS